MKKTSAMRQIAIRWVVSLVILVGGVSAMLALGGRKAETRTPDTDGLAPLLEAFPVTLHTAPLDIEVDGIVTPYREIEIKAQVSGRIDRKSEMCRTGRYVRKGDFLIEIDLERYDRESSFIQAQIDELNTEVTNTEDLIQFAEREIGWQKDDLERILDANRKDPNNTDYETPVYSATEVDQANMKVNQSENALQTLQNKVRTTEAALVRLGISLDRAQDDRERAEIRAPIDGVIVSDTVELKAFVNTGTPLFVIEDTAAVEVKCNLEADELYWLWYQASQKGKDPALEARGAYELPAAPAIISYQLAGRSDLTFSWKGRLSRYDGIGVDERTRTVPCRIVIDQPRKATVSRNGTEVTEGEAVSPPALVRGMYVRVVIRSEPSAEFVKVPESAVRPDKKIWRVHDGQLEIVGPLPLVKIVLEQQDNEQPVRYWLVPKSDSGLRNGDLVAITAPTGAQPGMTVRVATTSLQDADKEPESSL